jgi:hypothetical protein
MATSTERDLVRKQIGDTTTPYFFPDDEVDTAIDEAIAYMENEGVSSHSTTLGMRAKKLLAAYYLVGGRATGDVRNRHVKSVNEADARLEFESLTAKAQEWKEEAMALISKLIEIPLDVSTFEDYVDAEINQL